MQLAALCREVLQEKDGPLSLIRVVDTFTYTRKGENAPEEMPNFPFSIKMVVSFKSGEATGNYSAKIKIISPSGRNIEELSHEFELTRPGNGHNIVGDLSFEITEEGLHWIEVYLNGDFMTKMPLRIEYERVVSDSGDREGQDD